MEQGIFQGLNQGLKQGLNSEYGTLIPVYDLDFREPVAQSFPSTAAGLFALVGATPDHIWTCQDTSGGLTDSVGSLDLTANGTAAQNRGAYGIGGGDYCSRLACESFTTSDYFEAADTSALNAGSTGDSVALLIVWRAHKPPASSSGFVGKRGGTGTPGWQLGMLTSGAVVATVDDEIGSSLSATVSGSNGADGAWHCAIMCIKKSAKTYRVFTDMGNSSSNSYAALTGDLDTATPFRLLGSNAVTNYTQICYAAAFTGTDADYLSSQGATSLATFWTHATDPTGLLTTQTRGSLISVPVAADKVGHFYDDTLPIGYHAALNDGAGGLGLFCNNAVTNEVTYSEDGGNWTGTNATMATLAGDAPDGFKSASSCTATSAGGYAQVESFASSLSTSTQYTYSIWVKRNGGSDVTGNLILRNATDATDDATQAFTATSTWQLVTLTFTTAATGKTYRLRCNIDNNTESLLLWGAQLNLGAGRGAYVRTAGATASLVASAYESTTAVIQTAEGRVSVEHVSALFSNSAGNHAVFDTDATPDRRYFYLDSGAFQMQNRDGASAIWMQGSSGSPARDTLYKCVSRWDVDAGGFPEDATYTGTYHVNGTAYATPDTDTTTVGQATRGIAIGNGGVSSTIGLDGFIERVRIYNEVGSEPTA